MAVSVIVGVVQNVKSLLGEKEINKMDKKVNPQLGLVIFNITKKESEYCWAKYIDYRHDEVGYFVAHSTNPSLGHDIIRYSYAYDMYELLELAPYNTELYKIKDSPMWEASFPLNNGTRYIENSDNPLEALGELIIWHGRTYGNS